VAVEGGGSGGGSGGSGGATGGSSGTSTGTSEFNANIESVANSQLINEVSTIGGGNQATKMVGWNAVPSGFEPLQRSIGGKKLAYQFSNFSGGLNKKTSARDISLSECTSATNICFGNQGKITVLGDAKLETGAIEMANSSSNATGYGAFVFNSAYSLASAPIKGNYEIIARGGAVGATNSGNHISFADGTSFQDSTCDYDDDPTITHNANALITTGLFVTGTGIPSGAYVSSITDATHFELSESTTEGAVTNGTLTFSPYKTIDLGTGGDSHKSDVAPSIYAQGNGVYACDANFLDLHNTPQALILVDRPDINNGSVPVTKWVTGKPLINSPTVSATSGVNTIFEQINHDSDTNPSADGEVTVRLTATTATSVLGVLNGDTAIPGDWGLEDTPETFTFYASWIFDGITETALSTFPTTEAMDGDALECEISIKHTAALPAGGDARINGMRVYFSKGSENDATKFFLAEASWEEGVKRSTDDVFIPWTGSNPYTVASFKIDSPPTLNDYFDINAYFADEVYDTAGNTSDIAPFSVKYKTSTIGADGRVYIGNVAFNAGTAVTKIPINQDLMMFSATGRPGCFPKGNVYESPSVEGGAITALESFSDKIVQFREGSVAVVNVSRENPYVESVFNNIGVANPCQVCRVPFGIAWANSEGCYLYDGEGVTSLTHGKFKESDWGLTDGSVVAGYELDRATSASTATAGDAVLTPSIGYDPRSKRLIIFKDISEDGSTTTAFVYDFMTQSWSEGTSFNDAAVHNKVSNFIIYKGNLSFWTSNNNAVIQNYSATPSGNQTIEYITKDIDFGAPSVRKKIYKIIVNYVPGGAATDIDVTYAVNGSGSFLGMDTNLGVAETSVIERVEIKPDATINNIYSLQLKFDGTAEETFEIEDITIIYRMKKVK